VAAPSEDLVCPIDFRYGRPEVRAIFSRERRFRRWLRVEAALARSSAAAGLFPASEAEAIERAAAGPGPTLQRFDELERETGHDLMALSRTLAEQAGSAGRWVHFGATSNDILDTALGLELRESAEVLGGSLEGLLGALLAQAQRHQDTPMVARTHGQHAVPFTFGYKLSVFLMEFLRHRERLREMLPRIAVGKMAGAVGTGASFGEKAERIERGFLEELKLGREPAPSQLVGRDRLAEFLAWCALVASSADRVATEVRNLQRTEIAEVQEPFDERSQVGSSTMAQKRNPVHSENVSSIARLLRALPGPAYENMVQWHERDLANSANERFLLPHAVILLDEVLRRLTRVVSGLRVDEERMRRNLAATQGAVMAEALMLALTDRGIARSEAHEVLRRLTRDLDAAALVPLQQRAEGDETLRRAFRPEEIRQVLDPASYLAASGRKARKVLEEAARALGRS
jgi:adenylosuccinate lyase